MSTPPLRSVLIVDDEPSVREVMARWVGALGLQSETAASADEALDTISAHPCELAVVDVRMPGHDGFWLAGELRQHHPHTAVVIATSHSEPPPDDRKPRDIVDLLIKPFERGRLAIAIERGRAWRRQAIDESRWRDRLTTELEGRTADICGLVRRKTDIVRTEADVLAAILFARAPGVLSHGVRVARQSVAIAHELCLEGPAVKRLEIAARLHDIGQAAIPGSLLEKPAPLTSVETAIMRRHVDGGTEILSATEKLADLAPIVFASHEWFSGGGYPSQTSRDAIPLASRIIAVADAYDAMTEPRVYRTHVESIDPVNELLRCCPSQFDPEIVDALLRVLGRR